MLFRIPIAEKIVKEKKEEDIAEGRDISFLAFISQYQETTDTFRNHFQILWESYKYSSP